MLKTYFKLSALSTLISFLLLTACVPEIVTPQAIPPNTQTPIPSRPVLLSEPIPVTRPPVNSEWEANDFIGYFPLFTDTGYDGPDSYFDFDRGFTNSPSQPDIQFIEHVGERGDTFSLKPINGAVGVIVDAQTYDYSVCEQAISLFTPDPIPTLDADILICLMTDLDYLVSIRIKSLHHLGMGSIGIEFVLHDRAFTNVAKEFATKFPTTSTPLPPPPTPLLPTTVPVSPDEILISGFYRLPAYIVIRATFPNEPAQTIDLDNGEMTEYSNGDIFYYVGCGSDCFYFLRIQDEATMLVIGSAEPTFDTCRDRLPEFSIAFQPFFVGDYLCILTNENHLSILRVEALSPRGEGVWVEVSFRTYAQTAEGVCRQTDCYGD